MLEVLSVVYRILFLRVVAECGPLLLYKVVVYAGCVVCCVLLCVVVCCCCGARCAVTFPLFDVGVLVCCSIFAAYCLLFVGRGLFVVGCWFALVVWCVVL